VKFRENWGSILSLIVGAISFLGAVGQLTNPSGNLGGLVAGPVMIFGALIYRSAKKRRESGNGGSMRIIAEVIGLLVILFMVFGQTELKRNIILDPVPNFIIPLWALIAYAYAAYQAYAAKRETEIIE
jgi:hypothetical protein